MSEHMITWDHAECDTTEEGEHSVEDCNPRGTITCLAVDEVAGESYCRLEEVIRDGDYCESWSLCDYSEACHAMCPDFEHHDPGGEHCTEGHPIRLSGRCNVNEWIDNSDGVSESHDEGWLPEFKDGPIDVEWTGEGYLWSYVVDMPGQPV